jgi:hypothetical protein
MNLAPKLLLEGLWIYVAIELSEHKAAKVAAFGSRRPQALQVRVEVMTAT